MSRLCQRGWSRLLITGFIREYLSNHFASGNLWEPDLRDTVWRNERDTGILIESINKRTDTNTEKRPALIIKPNAYQNFKFGINDSMGLTQRGHRAYATAWVGSHTVFCIAEASAATELLAEEVAGLLHYFGANIRSTFGLLRWAVTEVGGLNELEESKENLVIPVTVGWAYQVAWNIEEESPVLRAIKIAAKLV